MEELQKSFVKALLNGFVRLLYHKDSELSFEDIIDQALGRNSLSRQDLESLSKKYISILKDLVSENPSSASQFLSGYGLTANEAIALEETWNEEKGAIFKSHLEAKEIEWSVKGEPSWSIDIQTIGKYTESTTLPIVNFKFDLIKQSNEKNLQFSVNKNEISQLLSALEQASLYLNSNVSS
jgi:hypothetical protein